MDLVSVLGIIGGIAALIGAIMLEHAEIVGSGYFNIPGIVIIGIGSLCAASMCYLPEHVKKFPTYCKLVFSHPNYEAGEIIEQMIEFAQKARREGLLSLEADLEKIHDPFFKKGLQLVVDGIDPALIRAVLETDTAGMEERHKVGESYLMAIGGIAPTMGILGAIMGLAGALAKMGGGDIMKTVNSLAIAFIASFYGVAVANLVFIPMSTKLGTINKEEIFVREITITGVLSIQAGDNPRIVEERLRAFFPPTGFPVKAKEGAAPAK
ncbi:MAG: MotA/TolQ/ExbB proton channel family protein [bacterium]|nr:MotA/TolQ/ExbB proton channel family protein [bacterium]